MSDNPKPIPRKTPGAKGSGSQSSGKKKGSGPSMREQILARRQAEAQGGGDSSAKETPKKAAPKKAAAKGSAAPAKKSSPATKRAASPGTKSAPKAAAGKTAAKPAATRGTGGSSRRKAETDGEGGTGRTRRARPEKKKSPVPMLAAGVLALGVAGGAFFMLTGDKEGDGADPENTETAAGADTDPTAEGSETGAAEDGAAETGTDAPDTAAAGAGAGTDADATAGDAAGGTETAPAETPAAKPKAAPKKNEPVDLSLLEPFGKDVDSTDEEWAKLQEWAVTMFDPDGGAASGRAKKKLVAAGKAAWPAILNEFIKLNPADRDQNQIGMIAQLALSEARGSDNRHAFDWRTPDQSGTDLSDKDLRFNLKLIKNLHESWAKVVANPDHWSRIDKSDVQKEAIEKAKAKIDDEFDDIDLEDIDLGDIGG